MNAEELSDLVHDVTSKSSSLKEAAALLRKASPEERAELLSLMAANAADLAALLERFRPQR